MIFTKIGANICSKLAVAHFLCTKLKMLCICVEKKKLRKGFEKNGPHQSCDLHKLGANFYSKLPVAPFLCKKVWYWVGGWVDEWMGGAKAGLRIAYSNQKFLWPPL